MSADEDATSAASTVEDSLNISVWELRVCGVGWLSRREAVSSVSAGESGVPGQGEAPGFSLFTHTTETGVTLQHHHPFYTISRCEWAWSVPARWVVAQCLFLEGAVRDGRLPGAIQLSANIKAGFPHSSRY